MIPTLRCPIVKLICGEYVFVFDKPDVFPPSSLKNVSAFLEERLDIDYIRPIEHHNMGMAGYHSISIHSTGATVTCYFIGGLGVDDVACIHHKLLSCSTYLTANC